jgi:hypothetical protein
MKPFANRATFATTVAYAVVTVVLAQPPALLGTYSFTKHCQHPASERLLLFASPERGNKTVDLFGGYGDLDE